MSAWWFKRIYGEFDLSWHDRAACKDGDVELWFPNKGREGRGATTPAKALCATCDVRTQCLDYAIAANEEYGIWGGLNRRERDAVRRNRAQQSHKG